MRTRQAFAVALVLAASVVAEPASAQISVRLEGCGELGEAEVARALAIEIEGAPTVPLGVRVACDDVGIVIEVDDPITDKRLARRVAGEDARRPAAARAVALLVSELVLASWAELLLEREEPGSSPERAIARAEVERSLVEAQRSGPEAPTVPGEPATARSGESAALSAEATSPGPRAEGSLPERPDAPSRPVLRVRADVSTGLRIRDVEAPFVTWLGALEALAHLEETVSLGARVSVELTEIERRAGTVSYSSVGGGLLVSIELVRSDRFVLDLLSEARFAWVRLDGRPSRSSIEGRAVDDVLAELELCVAPGLELGPVRLALSLSLGAAVAGPTGTVSGEPSVTVPGFFGGAGLRAGLR